jgi:hypothetical protein
MDGPVETVQPPYHMFRREIEDEILPYAADHNIGVLVYGPLAHGLLTGTMRPESTFSPDDWRSKSPDFSGDTFRRNLAVVGWLKALAASRSLTLPQLAVAWTLAHPAVHAAIVGARRPSHLEGTTSAADVDLSEEELREIDDILSDVVPVWGLTLRACDRRNDRGGAGGVTAQFPSKRAVGTLFDGNCLAPHRTGSRRPGPRPCSTPAGPRNRSPA